MISRSLSSRRLSRCGLMFGASLATLAMGLVATPAAAQTLGATVGSQAGRPRPPVQQPSATPRRSPTMQAALARQQSTQTRVNQIRAYANSLRQAVDRAGATDGLSENGLDPTEAIRDAVAAVRAGDTERASQLLVSAGAANDPTGLKTWEGAGLPSQTVGTDGKVTVVIDQTQERALLSWNRFNVGANTTLQFNQKSNGTAQPEWVAVNRVTNSVDPSLILGNLKADGTVVVLNRSGIIFGKNSQVNTHSLLASTLELGNAVRFSSSNTSDRRVAAMSIRDRNAAFLESGLFTPGNGTLSPDPTGDPEGPGFLVSAQAEGTFTSPSAVRFGEQIEGSVLVDGGAQISSGAGGFLMLAAPEIHVDGSLHAVDGQVSLQAGRLIAFAESTGAESSLDPYVRGYKFNSLAYDGGSALSSPGSIVVGGAIQSERGFLSLGTSQFGSVTLNGYLEATTSVSRNGKIELLSGSVTLGGNADPGHASGIAILPDANGETIPRGSAAEPAGFKSSQIVIATQLQGLNQLFDVTAPTDFVMGENAVIYAPNADVKVGVLRPDETDPTSLAYQGSVEIGRGAVIDVSGLKDVILDASRNQIEITPVKRNELRDTPNYREVALDGNFTLNGATLYVDPRLSGVRDDGVAWIGSPLIEAGSLAGQIPATAAEFMTAGGTVDLQAWKTPTVDGITAANAPTVRIARDAVIDFSGGWVRYAAGTVRTSRLISKDGRIVDISKADPNEIYVGVVDGYTEVQPRFGILRNHLNAPGHWLRTDAAYDEGRDAGSFSITGTAVTIDGSLYGNAFAGSRQIAESSRPTLASAIAGDLRGLQTTPYELPSGGRLAIETFGDAIIYHGVRGSVDSDVSELLLDDGMLTGAGLSALQLRVAGAVTFANAATGTMQSEESLTLTGDSYVELAAGGVLDVQAGRTTRFDGTVVAPSGRITAETTLFGGGRAELGRASLGSLFRQGFYGDGTGDDLAGNFLYASDPGAINPFDVVVTGTLSTAGLWINDYRTAADLRERAFQDGGSISLTVAPNVFMAIGDSLPTATQAVDLSGSIRVSGTLNVSSGGYVTSNGNLDLSGQGGNVSLVNATSYASTRLTDNRRTDGDSRSDFPVNGDNQSVDFTPIPPETGNTWTVLPALVPTPSSTVDIAVGTIVGYGFAGGGTFSLTAPDISFGSDARPGSTHIGLDFFQKTGFGTLDLTSYRARIVDDVFTNERAGKSAFLETSRFVVREGETFDLTQWVLPSILSADQARQLRTLSTGADLLAQSFLQPLKPASAWDQRGANLVLDGLTELNVMAGGAIVGAPEASITVTKLHNAGKIVLPGGSITQRNDLPEGLVVAGLGVRDAALGGNGLADAFGGPLDALGRFDETAANAAGISRSGSDILLTNRELVSRTGDDRIIYFTGLLDHNEGIVLDAGSITDLSGVALYDPRAPILGSGSQMRTGRVVDGGALRLSSGTVANRPVGAGSTFRENLLIRDDAARVDISGASGVYDLAIGMGKFRPYLEYSSAGTIAALGGGSLGTTSIAAFGGAEAAQGGTLEWLRPTVGDGDGAALDYLSADMIGRSGFDSLVARGGSLTLDGDFTLSLRKSLMVTSRGREVLNTPFAVQADFTIAATEGTDATVQAGYIRFASSLGRLPAITAVDDGARAVFVAGAQGLDIVGGVGFQAIASLTLASRGDLRFTGVNELPGAQAPTYDGQLVASGDLLLDARRVYATTGTGNYQGLLEGLPAEQAKPYDIAVVGDHSITFGNSFLDSSVSAPLSAGTHLRVLAPRIVQNGFLAAPLGLLELGSTTPQIAGGAANIIDPTTSIIFGTGSVTTVSASGMNIPYGTTSDVIEYYFPTLNTPITKLPTGELRLAATSIVQEEGALFDGRGGGDVYGYEFVPGVGGSRDVLDRFNRDQFSSNHYDPNTGTGYQYADRRQVFALVPLDQAGAVAPYDPVYSADYGAEGPVDLYGAGAGQTVILEGGPGVPAGEYLLVPAKYAMAIPGALRLVENTGIDAAPEGQSAKLLDGSVTVSGRFGTAGTGIVESQRRSFTVQSKDVFTRYSNIDTTSASQAIRDHAAKNGTGRPRLPLDAGRVVLAPLSELKLAGAFDLTAGEGGQGGQVDILGANILIAGADAEASEGVLLISDATLAKLDAPSLLIGGRRSDNPDGTTAITATASQITVAGDARLAAGELLLAVGGPGSVLSIQDGASLNAIGDPSTQTNANYVTSGAGSILRLANGTERLIARSGTGASSLEIGAATLSGEALALDTSGTFIVSDDASLGAKYAAVSGSNIHFAGGDDSAGEAGVIGTGLAKKLAAAERLTVRSPSAIRFAAGTHSFNDLILDTASIASVGGSSQSDAVILQAGEVLFTNSLAAGNGCATAGFCGTAGTLTVDASTITFGTNAVRAAGFGNAVTLTGRDGMYVEGKGSFSADAAALTLNAPFLVERAQVVDPRDQAARPDYTFLTTGDFVLSAAGTNTAAIAEGNLAPGARIGIGTEDARVASARIEGSRIRATAGIVDIQSEGEIALVGGSIETPGYERTFGDKEDAVTVAAGGGTVNLASANGNIITDRASQLVVDSGVGSAGALNLLASNGLVTLEAALNPAVVGERQASLALDSGLGAFDLTGFVAAFGARFGGDIAIRSGAGNLALGEGQLLKAESLALTADGGRVEIAGKIDTSGVDVSGLTADAARNARVNGGDISLWGNAGVVLASTAVLDTHTTGYADSDSRPASAGDVTIGIGSESAALTIAAGATIDVGARRTQAAQALGETGARLIPETITDPLTGQRVTVYRYAEADLGGAVRFRAPVIGANDDRVNVSLGGTVGGARSIELEGFLRYDLDALLASGQYAGISGSNGSVTLDFAEDSATTGRYNPFTEDFVLGDGTKSMVRFIQTFDVATVDGSSLEGVRLRPGVELVANGDITTQSQWNLAAATFSDAQLEAAVAAGDLELIDELSNQGAGGRDYHRVVSGREGHLLENHATFLYRVGGSAAGEAPVVTMRAGGDLTINRTISDGFFVFRDKSDGAYMSYQLGGGDRTYSPAFSFSCPDTNCGNAVSYTGSMLPSSQTVVIQLGSPVQPGTQNSGDAYVNAPLALSGNGAGGVGTARDAQGNPAGDPLGFAELFPLLSDGSAIHSSDLRLVAGTGGTLSANPLQVDRGLAADVKVTGEASYLVQAVGGSRSYSGPLQFRLQGASGLVAFDVGDTLNAPATDLALDTLPDDAQTQINFGSATTGAGADARTAALAYFTGRSDYLLVGSTARPTALVAPLSTIIDFLQSFESSYRANLAQGRPGYSAAPLGSPISYGTTNTAYVRSYVRSGDGDIDVIAARDIDIRGTDAPKYRRTNGQLVTQPDYGSGNPAGQFGAAAIYTAGVRAAAAPVEARIIGGGARMSLTPDSPYLVAAAEALDFVPKPMGPSGIAPALALGGGDVLLDAGRDILGQRETWSDLALASPTQQWRTGAIGADTEIGLLPGNFASGVGALAGGDVTVQAGRDVRDLTIALTNGMTTSAAGDSKVMLSLGTGNLIVAAGRDILAGRYDIASGAADIHADRDIAAFGSEPLTTPVPAHLRVRLSDAVVNVSARGSAELASVSALGVFSGSLENSTPSTYYTAANAAAAGFFSPIAAFNLAANENASILGTTARHRVAYGDQGIFSTGQFNPPIEFVQILPPSLSMISISASTRLPANLRQMLYPSPIGQLRLFSQGDISGLTLTMSDVDPGLLGGAFTLSQQFLPYRFPIVTAGIGMSELRYQHAQNPTHLGDAEPVRIFTNGDLAGAALFLPKQARVTAAGDIVNLFFQGQNLALSDVTRIRAGGDIRGTLDALNGLPAVVSNNFILGGPGRLIVEAGRDLGPFMTSANTRGTVTGDLDTIYTYGGGIRTVGNDLNPWLDRRGADLDVRFGMAGGADYVALRETYLNPENFAQLDGDLFDQITDQFGNSRPDRAKPVYASRLAQWLREKDPGAFAAIFGDGFPDTEAGNAALAEAAYGKTSELYSAFAAVDPLRQQDFLVNDLLFGEIGAVGNEDGPSFQQYVRGYRAIQTLFPTSLGYTDNLAPYTLDPATISPDHPLGEPVRNIVNGEPEVARQIRTGNLDLRLATVQSGRGGNVTILGPGGDLIAGSVVRTADQPNRRTTTFTAPRPDVLPGIISGSIITSRFSTIASIPLGYEGLLTLEGGQIRTFTDGDVQLNQSRVFTQQGGNITMWSSNGDLAAGQGPKSASNFPPVTIRLDENGNAEVDSAGSVSGAGIGAFQRSPDDPLSSVILIAPVGTVDAGDAGVRASGNIVVAAARVSNADNFTAAGEITGVPSQGVTQVAVTNPASEIQAQLQAATEAQRTGSDRPSIITVDVLGPASDGVCPADERIDDPDCR